MFALIQNGLVHELIRPMVNDDGLTIPIADRFTPELVAQMVEVPAGIPVEAGWSFDGGQFLPPAPAEIAPAPQSVTMRQARLALLERGLLDDVNAAISAITDDGQRKAAQIEWEFAATVDRSSAFTQQLAAVLSLDQAKLDSLFTLAATK